MTDDPQGQPQEPSRGADFARRALEEARAAAKAAGKSVGQGRSSPRGGGVRRLRGGSREWSGPRPDSRDPALLGSLFGSVARSRGWSDRVAEGTVLGCWDRVVGPDVAQHAHPTALVDKTLHVEATSTAWATQLRLMQSQILAHIATAVGSGVVKSLRITGPAAPSWRKGTYHVKGRGPRDTYG